MNFLRISTLIPLLCIAFGFRPFGLTLIYIYAFCSFFQLFLRFGLKPFLDCSTFSFCAFSIIGVVLVQSFVNFSVSLVLLVYYLPFMFLPYFHFSFKYNILKSSIFTVKNFTLFVPTVAALQLFFQFLQFFSKVYNFDISNLNNLLIPVLDFDNSVFMVAGLSMMRFSGIFNQPLDCGLFWYSVFLFSIFSSVNIPLVDLKPFNSQTRVGVHRRLTFVFLILSCIFGCLLCGSKVILLFIPFIILLILKFLSKYLNKPTFSFLPSLFVFLSLFLIQIILQYILPLLSLVNPLVSKFSDAESFVSIDTLTARRISNLDNIFEIDYSDNLYSLFGIGYGDIIYDNGYMYTIAHIGIAGLFLVITFFAIAFLAKTSHFSLSSPFSSYGYLFWLRIISLVSSLFLLIGGSVLTLHKASVFFLVVICFIHATSTFSNASNKA